MKALLVAFTALIATPAFADDVSHLTTSAVGLLAETDERRIRAIRSRRWVFYPRAKQALERLSTLLDHPRRTRVPSAASMATAVWARP